MQNHQVNQPLNPYSLNQNPNPNQKYPSIPAHSSQYPQLAHQNAYINAQHVQINENRNAFEANEEKRAQLKEKINKLNDSISGGSRIFYVIWLIGIAGYLGYNGYKIFYAHIDENFKIVLLSLFALGVFQSLLMLFAIKAKSTGTANIALFCMGVFAIGLIGLCSFFGVVIKNYVKPPGEDSNIGIIALYACLFIVIFSFIVNLVVNICVGLKVKKDLQERDFLESQVKLLD